MCCFLFARARGGPKNGQIHCGVNPDIFKYASAKFPPLFDGSTSWFNFEELIGDWLGLAVLEKKKNEDQH